MPEAELLSLCDVAIAIGGDGSLIHAARKAVKYKKPILGVNAGNLAFMAGIEKNELELLKELAAETGKTPAVTLTGFGQTGVDAGKIAGGFSFPERLGGKKGYSALEKYCDDNKIDLYVDYETVRFKSSGGGVNKSFDTAKTPGRQAASTVGQCELMYMYDKMFSEYGHKIGQLLFTKSDVESPERRKNLINTFDKLFSYGAIPVVNENDAIGVEEIVYGDNDCLSAIVAKLIGADALIILTDTDGLYNGNPTVDEDAEIIPTVTEITDELIGFAGGHGSKFGTGGMVTKLHAAQIAMSAGIDMIVMNGSAPEDIYKALDGKQIGTFFVGKKD